MNSDEVNPKVTYVTLYKDGEMLPKMRQLALANIKAQRERGMPKDIDAFEIGMNICINGRHFGYLGSTIGTTKGGYKLTPKDVIVICAKMIAAAIKRGDFDKGFSEYHRNLFLERDHEL